MTAPYTLTKIKSFLGREGHGLNATICFNGKPVAFVCDDANGGPLDIDFGNPLQNAASHMANKDTHAAAEAACMAWALDWLTNDPAAEQIRQDNIDLEAKYGVAPENEHQKQWSALESWINHTADAILLAKKQASQLNRWAKTKTVFRLKGDAPGEFRTLNRPVQSPGVLDHLLKKHGDLIEMIHGIDLATLKIAA